ncbi:AI-2E family transporter [Luteimonas fraxinea]|uniref:AI-2E family transporter n=1 Tax=Luteimonas fraxinea TaxID=2901869 RepID=A0ABS8UG76_9GAMM|nr:AI-2E family transporter [Luteimonas fraxinea]MCD9097895.1 AI-2E family transporter [Luteimonas fraxinea]MCD9125537.1 AI-2E family transporter [Luteimonas fraxinea]UHH09370.1 AI-2E family transporter [Luteimonas fraxinea]
MIQTDPANADIARFLKRLQWGLVAFAVGYVIWLLGPILTPFVLALLLGWLGDPLVDRLERRGRSRAVAVTLVFLLMTLLLALVLIILVPMIERQIVTLIDSLPQYRDWLLGTALPWIEQRTGYEVMSWLDTDRLIELIRGHWQQAGGVAATVLAYASRSGFAILALVINLVLVPILAFYFMRDWDLLVERVAALIPRDHIDTATRLARETSESLGGFLRGQFLVMLGQGAIYAVGMSIVGLRLGLLIGMVAGLISFIPYLGATVGILLALIAAIVQAQGFDWQLLILIGVVFTIGQLVESYVLTPRLVGDRIGLHPVAVIFAVLAGGQLFGFLGMLLALPVAAVVNVLLRYAHERYTHSRLYAGDKPDIEIAGAATSQRPVIIVTDTKGLDGER